MGVKMKKGWKIFIGIMLGLMVITSIVVPFSLLFQRSYDISSKIFIINDRDFERYNFPGIGTESDPYIIENYKINITSGSAIYIYRTTKFFIIRDCIIHSDWNSIRIFNVGSGTATIINNICYTNIRGIEINNSPHSYINNNTCIDGDIQIVDSANINIINNTCINDNSYGISIINSPGCTLLGNNCSNCQYGITSLLSTNVTLANNSLSHNDIGIRLHNSTNVILENNTINNNYYGIECYFTNFSIIYFNSFTFNSAYAIYLTSGFNNSIYHNNFIDNNENGTSQAFDDGLDNIWYNTLISEGNYWSDWLSGDYHINGSADATDPYPLDNPFPI